MCHHETGYKKLIYKKISKLKKGIIDLHVQFSVAVIWGNSDFCPVRSLPTWKMLKRLAISSGCSVFFIYYTSN